MSAPTLAILASHPIQYYVPWFRHLAARRPIEVLYCHRQDPAGQAAAGFGVAFDWDVPLLDGYPHRWLENVARVPSVATWAGCDTPELARLVPRRGYGALLLIGWNRKSAFQAIRACRRARVPVLSRGDSQLATPRGRLWSAAKVPLYRALLGRIDAHLYVGERNRAYLARYGVPPERLFFAPHFVDHAFFERGAAEARRAGARESIRRAHGIPEGAVVALLAGKWIDKKRPLDLVRAVAALAERPGAPEVWALLVGDGPLRSEIEAAAGPRVRLAGFRNQSEMPAVYAASDLLALPSDARETWGLVANEAMAAGLPLVASEAAGCAPDLVEPGRTGFVHALGDVAGLAEALAATAALLRADPAGTAAAVTRRIAEYSMEAATRGLDRALAATGVDALPATGT